MKSHDIVYKVKQHDTLRGIINEIVKKYPNNVAFTIKNINTKEYTDITYTQFKKDINAFGTAILEKYGKNKRIAVIGKNRYEWVIAYYAALFGDNTIIPLDKGLPAQEIESLLNRAKADILVFEEKYNDIILDIKNNNSNIKDFICMDELESFVTMKELITYGKNEISKGNNKFEKIKINPNETRIILFTSGTTSTSKAVMLSNRNIASNNWAMNSVEDLLSTDVYMAFLPFHHTFGSAGLLTFLSNGAKVVFCDGLRYIKQNLAEYKVTVFVSVPLIIESMYKKIQDEVAKKNMKGKVNLAIRMSRFLTVRMKRKLFKEILDGLGGELRLVINGGAAVNPEALAGFLAFGINTLQGYGLTETSPILTMENDTHVRKGTVGLPVPNIEMKLDNVNENGIGEVIAKGPSIMKGYYENSEATNEVLKNGWFYTGDLGRVDKDGYLYLTGRKKNVIVLKNGKNVFPEELETELSSNPMIAEVLVYDTDKNGDSMLSAKVVYNKEYFENNFPNISEEEIKEKIWNEIKKFNKTMTNYKHIKALTITDEPMEKTTTNKIKRFQEIEKIKNNM